ncbi:MAG: hypothetical protein PHG91_12655 [Syntrophales bacterium]|nr:hypothetical protein [Syntrophales bacterium]MDD5234236.1 hypothetical protein [Syntrophales bacterium]MDD5532211.1 hypothetical protein [Syntrophales bacterium]
MKIFFRLLRILYFVVLCLFVAVVAHTEQERFSPVSPPLVREGDFAVKLTLALGLAACEGEEEAEDRLSRIGIAPRSGWISDHPVTPDIAGELRAAAGAAADAGRLALTREETLKRFDYLNYSLGLPGVSGLPDAENSGPGDYPDSAHVQEYYQTQGPPVITYQLPPPGFVGLYVWVPYAFRYCGSPFSGYYIRRDIHQVTIVRKRAMRMPDRSDAGAPRTFRTDRTRVHENPSKDRGAGSLRRPWKSLQQDGKRSLASDSRIPPQVKKAEIRRIHPEPPPRDMKALPNRTAGNERQKTERRRVGVSRDRSLSRSGGAAAVHHARGDTRNRTRDSGGEKRMKIPSQSSAKTGARFHNASPEPHPSRAAGTDGKRTGNLSVKVHKNRPG